MTVQITWTDLNTGAAQEDGFRVYRSSSEFTETTLPAVLATLAADSTSYDDTTAVIGDTYYYMVEVFKGAKSAFTPLKGINVPTADVTFNSVGSLLPRNIWSMAKRISSYLGPACRVVDASNSLNQQDIYFGSGGLVLTPAPYADTRVMRWYDQMGITDLVPTSTTVTDYPEYRAPGFQSRFRCSQVSFIAGALKSEATGTQSVRSSFMVDYPVLYVVTHKRPGSTQTQVDWVAGVPTTEFAEFMSYGVWLAANASRQFHSRVEGGPGANWTDPASDADGNDTISLIMDCGATPAKGYQDNIERLSYAWTPPMHYDSAATAFYLGGHIFGGLLGGSGSIMVIPECAVFTKGNTAANSTETTILHSAKLEIDL